MSEAPRPPMRERTYDVAGTFKVIAGIAVAAMLGVAGFTLYVAFGRIGAPEGRLTMSLFGVIVLLAASVAILGLLRMSRAAVRVGPDGITQAPGADDARAVPWSMVQGSRRRRLVPATVLTDAQGNPLVVLDDRLDGIEQCLDQVADLGSFARSSLPTSFSRRGVPSTLAMLALVLLVAGGFLLFDHRDMTSWVFLGILFAAGLWAVSQEVVGLELADDGVTVRRVLDRRTWSWDDVVGASFRLRTSRNHRWVEAVLDTRTGRRKLVPSGAPMLAIVATVRNEVRRRGLATAARRA